MGFRDHVATAFGHLHTAFGADDEVGEVTWDPGDDEITCDAIVGSISITPDYGDGEDHVETRSVTVQTADIADPRVGDIVVIGLDKWRVVAVERAGFGSAMVRVAGKTPVAREHEGHTKRMV